ncbi:hypothetical protein DL765_002401 [Monosporascus sp. GIB2]|nr:hypothetical protein DL765_002401 [Monosporascus sp. GIB2]
MGIADILIKLTKELHSLTSTARAAPKEVEHFARETSTFTDLLDHFSEVVKRLPESKDEEAKRKKKQLFRNVKNGCEVIKRGIEELLGKFIQLNDGGLSPLRTLWTRLLWVYRRNDVEFLRRCLESSKTTVSILATLFSLEQVNAGGGGGAGVGRVEIMVKLETQLQNKLFELQEVNQELEEYERHHHITLHVAQGAKYSRMRSGAYDVEKYAAREISSQREATARRLSDLESRERPIHTRLAPQRDFSRAKQNQIYLHETNRGNGAGANDSRRRGSEEIFVIEEEVERESGSDGHTSDRPTASTGPVHDSDDESAGPYRPVAPFGGSGDRRRPRRPRPQSPIG